MVRGKAGGVGMVEFCGWWFAVGGLRLAVGGGTVGRGLGRRLGDGALGWAGGGEEGGGLGVRV